MQMKKRVLSVLLALCLAGSLASTAWAAGDKATPETAEADPAAVVLNEEEEQQDETTVSQEETSGEDSTAAPAEDPVAQVTETEADDGSVEYTAALETDGQTMNVVVTAPEGAFAEDVQPELSVTMLTAEDELNAVADKLATAEVQYDGFTALDITFTDKATGEEIEPVQQVSVRIELPKAIVDSGIDLNTLAVQHLEEDENGDFAKVTKVATLDNGITLSEEAAAAANEAAGVAPMSDIPAEEATAGDTAETPAAVAEFDVDGFSTFTLTWGIKPYFRITVHYVDESGKDIQGTHTVNDSFSNGSTITFADYAGTIAGYTYQAAHYQSIDGAVITSMEATQTSTGSGWNKKTYYTITFYNDGKEVSTDHNSMTDWNQTKDRDIYLVYKQDSGSQGGGDQGGTTVTNATVTTSKTAVLKDDDSGYYDLTLSISGDRGSSSKKQKVDILFILDKSGSMDYALDKDDDAEWWESSRMDLLQQAVGSLVDTIARNESIDARYGAVAFARSQQRQTKSWTDASSIKSFVNGLDPNGGTNYQQGIYDGKQLLNSKRADALTFVIFVSDGEPTYRGINVTNSTDGSDYSENGTGNGQDDSKGYNIAAAVQEISNMACDYFYAIGMGPEFGKDWWGDDKTGTENLKNLANAVQATSKGDNNVFSASATDTLEQAFKDIAASVTFFAATDVTITDPLSQYADIVPNANGAAEFTVTVTRTELKDEEGTVTSEAKTWEVKVTAGNGVEFQDRNGNNVTVTPAYNNGTITLTFPHSTGNTPGYELEPGYTYSISTVITPSETAKNLGMDSDAAKQTPDPGTGTHADANQQGFWSNINDDPNTEAVEGAQVTFTANGEEGSQAFLRPVIQVPEIKTADLTITKDVQGIDSSDLSTENGNVSIVEDKKYEFKVEKLDEDGNLDTDFTENDFKGGQKTVEITVDANGDGTAVLEDLPLGEYKVTESSYPQEFGDYTFDTKSGEETAILEDENGDSVTVINTYKHKDKTLTVTKQVIGDLAVKEDSFEFTLELQNADGSVYDGDPLVNDSLEPKEGSTNKYTFNLTGETGSNSIRISLPHGVKAIVTETDNSDYTKVESRLDDNNFAESDNQNANMTGDHTIDFRNTKNVVTPPTGLERNDTPYTLMVTAAGIAGLALIGGIVAARRRRRRME